MNDPDRPLKVETRVRTPLGLLREKALGRDQALLRGVISSSVSMRRSRSTSRS